MAEQENARHCLANSEEKARSLDFTTLVHDIRMISSAAHSTAGRALDRLLTLRNWLIGAYLVEYEQTGEDRASYGDQLLPRLAGRLEEEGQKGLSVSNLKNCRQVALTWPGLNIERTLSAIFMAKGAEVLRHQPLSMTRFEKTLTVSGPEFPSLVRRAEEAQDLRWQDEAWVDRLFSALSFSHLLELSRVDGGLKRAFYEVSCLKEGWTVRELQRQRDSLLYERAGLSKDPDAVLALSREGKLAMTPATEVRDPYVLEFLGLKELAGFTEKDLESALIDHLQELLLEFGRDFCFVARQFRMTVANVHHYLDLLFYHRGLRSLVAVELKVESFKPEHAGQMNFYLNYLAERETKEGENPPVGILLCSDKEKEVVHFGTAANADSFFVSKYLLELPSEEELSRWVREWRSQLNTLEGSD